ncbi:DUF2939 domain-containing protein [Oryzomonas rubra]|uniref:DUF2939 domain-containing protein n=1 Tax=Oryzomonas rubra TaxID=2509454 RepID=A0A5A9XPV5_9BACT|nr:DUF2939 domain-containing protein [Oryzomonas rubra]KAA0894288.1 DUF2939 domain-containing protein [Oryzomonas rubra]
MKKLMIFVGVIVVVVVSVFVYAKGTPQYSLYQFRKAVENHDADTAMKYFDVDSIVDNFMNDFMKSQDEKKPANEFEAMGNNLAKGLIAMMLPAMKESLKGQLKTGITTPSDDKTPVKDIRKGSLSDFEIKTEGKMAILSMKDNKNVKFKMVKTPDGHWKIVQLMMPNAMNGLQK